MKRDLSWVNKTKIKQIKRWIKNGDMERCPFPYDKCGGYNPTHKACKGTFPAMVLPVFFPINCPCDQFSPKYVRRVARQIVKDWEKSQKC